MKNQTKVIAAAFALAGFAVASLSGLAAGNPAPSALIRALIVMVVCHIVGSIAGAMLAYVAEEHVRAYEAARPIADLSLAPQGSAASGDEKFSKNLLQKG